MEATKILETFVICVIISVAVTGNISLWIIILKSRQLRTVTNTFILGLSAADLLVSIVNMPLTVSAVVAGNWPFSETSCTALGFFNMLFLVTSVMSLCNISINRYFMVCRPYKFKDVYTKRNAVFMIMAVVTLSILLSSPPLFGWGRYSYISLQSFCFCDWSESLSYAIFMILCCFGGPFSVMTVCNIFIYRTVRQSRCRVTKVKVAPASYSSNRDSGISSSFQTSDKGKVMNKPGKAVSRRLSLTLNTEQRLAMSLIVVVILFVVCWLPYCISMLLSIFHADSVPRGFHMFTVVLGYANSCCNPIIYGLMNTQFAQGFRDLYCWWKTKQQLL